MFCSITRTTEAIKLPFFLSYGLDLCPCIFTWRSKFINLRFRTGEGLARNELWSRFNWNPWYSSWLTKMIRKLLLLIAVWVNTLSEFLECLFSLTWGRINWHTQRGNEACREKASWVKKKGKEGRRAKVKSNVELMK